MEKNIVIKGACENNLQDLDVTIPRDRLVVFTGLSGSGKSSLAFDTIYAGKGKISLGLKQTTPEPWSQVGTTELQLADVPLLLFLFAVKIFNGNK